VRVSPATQALPPALPAKFSAAESALRLLVGSALIGGDELARHLRTWEQQVWLKDRAASGQVTSESDRIRHVLIGMLFVARQSAGKSLHEIVNQYQHYNPGRELVKSLDGLMGNPFLRPLLKPIRTRVDEFARRWGDTVERWIRIGRIEEYNSRALANRATGELIDEVLAYLAQNPAITDLIQQQSIGLAGEVIDDVRQTTATADDTVEAFLRRLLGRPSRGDSTPSAATAPTAAKDGAGNGAKDRVSHE
jgi:hypothetical protein